MKLVNIGYGNVVAAPRVVAVVAPESAPSRRLKDEARAGGRLVDATEGRRTRSIIITDTHHVILSALSASAIAERIEDAPLISATRLTPKEESSS